MEPTDENQRRIQKAQDMVDPDTLKVSSPLGWVGMSLYSFDMAELSRREGDYEGAMRLLCTAVESRGILHKSIQCAREKVAIARKGGLAKNQKNEE